MDEAFRLSPNDDQFRQSLSRLCTNWAWTLATSEDPSQRDPAKAVELANKALQLQPGDANHWNNLGVAEYRMGHWQAAVDSFSRADSMIESGDRAHRMFFAMAHWQLGNQEHARDLYAEGAAWIASTPDIAEEFLRFRHEAEELMGISEKDRKAIIDNFSATRSGTDRESNKDSQPKQ